MDWSQSDYATLAEGITTSQTRHTSDKGKPGKTSKKSWVRSVRTFFKRSIKLASTPEKEHATSRGFIVEQNLEVSTSLLGPLDQKAQKLISRSPTRERVAKRDEINDLEHKGTSGNKRSYVSVNNAHWKSKSADDSVKTGTDWSNKAVKGYQENMTGTTTISAAEICRKKQQAQESTEVQSLCRIHTNLSGEIQFPTLFSQDKITLLEANNGYGQTSEKVSKKKTVHKNGGNEDDDITFEVSMKDGIMKNVLQSIQEPDNDITFEVSMDDNIMKNVLHSVQEPAHAGPVKYGQGRQKTTYHENFVSSKKALEHVDGIRVGNDLGDPLEEEKAFAQLHISSSSNSTPRIFSTHSLNMVQKTSDRISETGTGGSKPMHDNGSVAPHCKMYDEYSSTSVIKHHQHTERRHRNSPASVKARKQKTKRCESFSSKKDHSQSAYQRKIMELDETIKHTGNGQRTRRIYPCLNSSTEYQDATHQRTRRKYPSSASSTKYHEATCRRTRRRYTSSHSSTEYRNATHRRTRRRHPPGSLRPKGRKYSRATMQDQMKKQRCQTGEVKHTRTGSPLLVQSKETDSSLSKSRKHYKGDTMNNDNSHSWKPASADVDRVYVTERNKEWIRSLVYSNAQEGEETSMSDNGTYIRKYNNNKNMDTMKYGQRRPRRARWNRKRRDIEQDALNAFEARSCQSSHHTFNPVDDHTTINSNGWRTIFGENDDTLRSDVNMSEITVSMTEERAVGFQKNPVHEGSGRTMLEEQVAAAKMNILTNDSQDDNSSSKQKCIARRGKDGDSYSDHVYENSNMVTTGEAHVRAYLKPNSRRQRPDEDFQFDPGPKNKWLQRMGNISLALVQEPEDYDAKDEDGSPQHGTRNLQQEAPEIPNTDVEQSFETEMDSKSEQKETVEMSCFMQLEPPTARYVEDHNKHLQSLGDEAPKQHASLCKKDVCSDDESSIRDVTWSSKSVSKNLNSVSQLRHGDVSQSTLRNIFIVNCCHVKNRNDTDGSPSSTPKGSKRREDSFIGGKNVCSIHSAFSADWNSSTSTHDKDSAENLAKESLHKTEDGNSRVIVSTCAHASPHRKSRHILAGAIMVGKQECREEVKGQPCSHEFIEHECRNEFIHSGAPKRRKKEETLTKNSKAEHLPHISDELDLQEETFINYMENEHVPREVETFINYMEEHEPREVETYINFRERHELQISNGSSSDCVNEEKAVTWKQCPKNYETTLKQFVEALEYAHSTPSACLEVREHMNDLDNQIQVIETDSNPLDHDMDLAPAHIQMTASCSNEDSRQKEKILQDDDKSVHSSKKFRDELFTTLSRESVSSSSRVLDVNCADCVDHKTRKTIHKVQRHLQDLTKSDPFRFSSVYSELLRVEQEINQIASAFASYSCLEETEICERSKTPSESCGLRNSEGRKCKEKVTISRNFCSENVIEPQVTLAQQASTLVQRELPKSKLIEPKTNCCGGPISITMASRLLDAEVPIVYEDGYKVQYVPVDKRGNIGMRAKPTRRKKRNVKLTVEERVKSPRKIRPYVDDSSSSSSAYQDMQDVSQEVESSSSESGAKLLYRRHRREVSGRIRRVRKQRFEGEDSDDTNDSNWSDDHSRNLNLFVGDVEEQLGKLKRAKVQLGKLSPESLARVNTFYKRSFSQTKENKDPDPTITKAVEAEPESSVDGQGKWGMCKKMSISKVATEIPLKRLTAWEIKEFHLLERRVQRELGAADRNTKYARSKEEKENISTNFSEGDRKHDDQITGGEQHHDTSNRVLDKSTEYGAVSGEASPCEQLNGHVWRYNV